MALVVAVKAAAAVSVALTAVAVKVAAAVVAAASAVAVKAAAVVVVLVAAATKPWLPQPTKGSLGSLFYLCLRGINTP